MLSPVSFEGTNAIPVVAPLLHVLTSLCLTKAFALPPHLPAPPPPFPPHFLPSWLCLRASPLEGQVNRRPGSAQVRLVPIPS